MRNEYKRIQKRYKMYKKTNVILKCYKKYAEMIRNSFENTTTISKSPTAKNNGLPVSKTEILFENVPSYPPKTNIFLPMYVPQLAFRELGLFPVVITLLHWKVPRNSFQAASNQLALIGVTDVEFMHVIEADVLRERTSSENKHLFVHHGYDVSMTRTGHLPSNVGFGPNNSFFCKQHSQENTES